MYTLPTSMQFKIPELLNTRMHDGRYDLHPAWSNATQDPQASKFLCSRDDDGDDDGSACRSDAVTLAAVTDAFALPGPRFRPTAPAAPAPRELLVAGTPHP